MPQKCHYPCYINQRTPFTYESTIQTPIKTIFFDMDGVLADTLSSWRYIHTHFNASNQHSVNAYLNGQIDDLEFIKRDVSLWHHNGTLTTLNHIQQILDTIPLMPGAHELFNYLHDHDITTVIISAGLDLLAKRIASELSIPHIYANSILQDKNGTLTGEGILTVQLKYKDKNVQDFMTTQHLLPTQCAAVGNSCFDVPMLTVCGYGIAFNPVDTCIRDAADYIVEEKNLRHLIPLLEPLITTTKK
jgi:phosphoserine phosphatase